jgi:uncharacterized RDD family membrane protein YckC
MDWHYAENGQQAGPVSEEELLQLAQSGAVTPDTLIWHSGMDGWKPFREARPGLPPPLPSDAPKRMCASCNRSFPVTDLAIFGESPICAECKPAWTQRLRQGMTSTVTGYVRYAGFWIRGGALVIDGIITGAAMGIVFFLFFGGTFTALIRETARAGAQGSQPDPAAIADLMAPMMASMGLFQLLGLAASLTYYAWFLFRFGATPGKMAVGIKVVRPDGSPISVGQAIGRYFAHLLSAIILYVGFMMAGWDDQKRALHDRLADTRVIYKPSMPPGF